MSQHAASCHCLGAAEQRQRQTTIHVRTAKSSSNRGGVGRYSALKPLGEAKTICGAAPTTIDITPRDVIATLVSSFGNQLCQDCVKGVK